MKDRREPAKATDRFCLMNKSSDELRAIFGLPLSGKKRSSPLTVGYFTGASIL